MPEITYTATISGQTLEDLKHNVRAMANALDGENPKAAAMTPATQTATTPAAPAAPRRGRPPASQGAATAGNGATPPADTNRPIADIRQEATDILRACWGLQPDGAERVVSLQQKFNVKRFAEVSDADVPRLYQDALSLQAHLNHTAAAEPDTGPF